MDLSAYQGYQYHTGWPGESSEFTKWMDSGLKVTGDMNTSKSISHAW